ncbi:SH3 domain-containing protein [Colletotrichum tofieldiae]|uniref:SH3 domain-containing protein n=1 Tax=Colletotrichum tofieldiae TaxID=708197 RepID=A0A166YRE9_9PEZI|nr:SH3 domain-containing protein [Colletotrichum tofieldiae]
MAVDVEELIILPFREVVERGKEATTNAEEAQNEDPEQAKQMMKFATMITKEGERALKRLQPLWDNQVEKHGDMFKEIIADNDEIAEKRRVLEELLYDFEDFIEVGTFDSSKFAEVQAATRSFALDVLDSIKRMKIETKTPTTPVHAFPPLPPLPPLPTQSPKLSYQPGPAPPSRNGSQSTANFSLFPAVARHPQRTGTRSSHGSSDGVTLRRTSSIAKSAGSDPRSSHVYLPSNQDTAMAANMTTGRERGERRPSSPDVLGEETDKLRLITSQEPSHPWTSDWVEEQSSAPRPRRLVRGSIPENSAVTNHMPSDSTTIARFNRLGLENNSTPQSSVFDTTSPSTTNRTSVYSDSPTQSSSGPSPKMPISEIRASSLAAIRFEPAAAISFAPLGQFSDGLMLANEQAVSETSTQHLRPISTHTKEEDCSIGPKSSFHQFKGFCEGALSFRRGGYWNGLKQTMAYELSLDKEGDFHEGDATVFQSADQLLKHLACHPQPLPEVPGVTVLYGQMEKDHYQIEDYDIHFPSPPAPSPFPEIDTSQFPVATALKSHVQRWGENLVGPDGNPDVLKFFIGAKIVGVEFPEKWGGKWCMGWHDGVRGPFPAKGCHIINHEAATDQWSDETIQ